MSDLPPTEVDAVFESSPVVPPPAEMTTAPADVAIPAGAGLSFYELTALDQIGTAARENNESGSFRDYSGRLWEIMPDVIESHAVVLVRMTQGATVKVRSISTVVYSPGLLAATFSNMMEN